MISCINVFFKRVDIFTLKTFTPYFYTAIFQKLFNDYFFFFRHTPNTCRFCILYSVGVRVRCLIFVVKLATLFLKFAQVYKIKNHKRDKDIGIQLICGF